MASIFTRAFILAGASLGAVTMISNTVDAVMEDDVAYSAGGTASDPEFKKTTNASKSFLIYSTSDSEARTYRPYKGELCSEKLSSGQVLLFTSRYAAHESCRAITELDLPELREIAEKAGRPGPLDVRYAPMAQKTLQERVNLAPPAPKR